MTTARAILLASLLLAPTATIAAQPADTKPAVTTQPSTITTADALLTALETADKNLNTFHSQIRYTKFPNELVGGSPEQRNGELWFESRPASTATTTPSTQSTDTTNTDATSKPAADRRFQVEFKELILDNARRDDRQIWIFDGEWLTEKNFDTRLVHRRQLSRPGEKTDPLAIGEGPLPIPIGQKRERILERFDAALPAATDGAPEQAVKLLADTYQLHLKPKLGTQEARDYKEVRIWYRTSDLLPRLARAVHKDGSTTEILLSAMEVNKPLATTVFDTTTPNGWNEQIDDFRQAQSTGEE